MSTSASIIDIGEVPSTNTFVSTHPEQFAHGDVAISHCQTAGRGQRGNSWEAEPGKNLTFSFVMRSLALHPAAQFFISEAVSVAVVQVLSRYTPDITIKWPNDIYYRNSKICGILIENTILGTSIERSVAGIGININQREFHSPAPNPISLYQIIGKETPLDTIMAEFHSALTAAVAPLCDSAQLQPYVERLHQHYMQLLYRFDGKHHTFALPDGTQFQASITAVAPDGKLTLTDATGTPHHFYFKEVSFII